MFEIIFVLAVGFTGPNRNGSAFFGKESETEVFGEEYRLKEYIDVLKNRNVFILSIIAFIGVGIFTAYLTWVEPVLEEHGLDVETAGLTASALLFGGILGSILIPALSDRLGKRKPSDSFSFQPYHSLLIYQQHP